MTPEPEPTTIAELIVRLHAQVSASAEQLAARSGGPSSAAPSIDLYDAEMVTLSRHIAAVEAFLYPLARRRLEDGRTLVDALQRQARFVERLMRAIEGRLYGDSYAKSLSLPDLHDQFSRALDELEAAERSVAERLDSALPERERDRLARRLRAAAHSGPTRPHPYTPHGRGLGRIAFWGWSIADRAMDAMDNRAIPDRTRRWPRAHPGRWDRYVLGSADLPRAAEPPGPGGAERRTG